MAQFDITRDRVAIIAGGGRLPAEIIAASSSQAVRPVLIGIRGEIDEELATTADAVFGYGQLGSVFGFLADRGIRHVVFAGSIAKRPDFKSLRMDMMTLKELPRLLRIVMGGDNSVLEKISLFFAGKGVTVIGAHELAPSLLAGQGMLVGRRPGAKGMQTIVLAVNAARAIGALDIGQAAVAEDGRVVALEALEGTDGMLTRVRDLRTAGRLSAKPSVSVLAKMLKPDQDMRADLPAIGPGTIANAAAAGLTGIVVDAGRSIILDREKTLARARSDGVFIMGMDGGNGD